MAANKTTPGGKSVAAFLAGVKDPARRKDCEALVALMKRVTKAQPVLWGPSIVGFGRSHYVYESGREGDWMLTGFSPRAGTLVLYLMAGLDDADALLAKLGPHKAGKGCLYVKRLADVDVRVLERLVRLSVAAVKQRSG